MSLFPPPPTEHELVPNHPKPATCTTSLIALSFSFLALPSALKCHRGHAIIFCNSDRQERGVLVWFVMVARVTDLQRHSGGGGGGCLCAGEFLLHVFQCNLKFLARPSSTTSVAVDGRGCTVCTNGVCDKRDFCCCLFFLHFLPRCLGSSELVQNVRMLFFPIVSCLRNVERK